MEEGRSAFKILIGKPTGKRPLGRPNDNVRMDLEDIGINAGNWVDSAQGRNCCPCESAIEPPGCISHGISYLIVVTIQHVVLQVRIVLQAIVSFSKVSSSMGTTFNCFHGNALIY